MCLTNIDSEITNLESVLSSLAVGFFITDYPNTFGLLVSSNCFDTHICQKSKHFSVFSQSSEEKRIVFYGTLHVFLCPKISSVVTVKKITSES